MKELKETVALMNSADYKERFIAEYHQVETRFLKLKAMTEKWDNNELDFTPTCSRKIYDIQLSSMLSYLLVLLERAVAEKVEIDIDEKMKKYIFDYTGNQVIMSKQTRINIDSIIAYVKTMQPCREVSIAITKLQEAVMWMGMNLKRLNEKDPYPNSRNTNNGVIDPTADRLNF